MPRIAAIDIGTNSILLTVAEVQDGEIRTLCERSHITRLGEGLNATGRLSEEPIQRSLHALHSLLEEARQLQADTIIAVGTEVLRKAQNAPEFLQRCEQMGLSVEVISGEREAYLSYLSVAKDPLFVQRSDCLTMLDVGGGSTEVSRGCGGVLETSHSYPIGAVRLTEAHLHSDPPTAEEIRALQETVKQHLRNEKPLGASEYLVGVGGTFVNLASLHAGSPEYHPERVHGATLTLAEMQSLADRLCALPLAERRRLPGIEPERAPVLHAGALIALTAMQCLHAGAIAVSMRGLRWGIVYEFADAHRD
ncbi:Guanosine-5'-triphosphate,3'-diphosphate pyrophosphatase [bacterium HR16]|nr:Guanosine-5'-triphosphate,3'-diphosphate pyrophosphatase [bacterium HR16]